MSTIVRSRIRLILNHLPETPKSLWTRNRRSLHTIPSQAMSSQQSQYRKQISIAKLLQRYGLPSSQLNDFLSKNPSLVDSDMKAMENSLTILLLDFKIPQKDLASLVLDCPGVLNFKFLKNWESRFSKSELPSGSPLMIKSLLEHSRRFRIDSNELSRATRVIKGLGFSDQALSRVLEGFPGVTSMDETEIRRRIKFLSVISSKKEDIDQTLRSVPEVLGFGVENRLKPLLNEFKALGFRASSIRKEVVREPRLLAMEVGELSRCLELLRKLKCREAIKEKILREGELRAGFDVKLRVDFLCRLGLIRREAFDVLRKEPRAIIYEIEDIETKVDFLVKRMRFSVRCLIDVPEFLGVGLEKQIVSRFNVIEYLRSIDGLGFELGLRDMIKPTRLEFYNLYVKPYPECEKMFPRVLGETVVKKRQPSVGLWKSFTPRKYEETTEDVQNMKLFIVSLV